MKAEHRSALVALAARRGQKGFSAVLEEAIEGFLAGEAERQARRKNFLSLAGTLSEDAAEDLEREAAQLRARWR